MSAGDKVRRVSPDNVDTIASGRFPRAPRDQNPRSTLFQSDRVAPTAPYGGDKSTVQLQSTKEEDLSMCRLGVIVERRLERREKKKFNLLAP